MALKQSKVFCFKIKAITLLVALSSLISPAVYAEPDEGILGKAQNYPSGSISTWYGNAYRVGSWSAMDQVAGFKTRLVERSSEVRTLPRVATPVALNYRFRNLNYSVAEYLERQRITGLLVLKNGEIVTENYRYGRQDSARFLSFSMAKSVTSLLIGVAHTRGLITSLDDTADKYVKALADSPYGATTIRQLLRMSSGLTFSERYDGNDDLSRLTKANDGVAGAGAPVDVLRSIKDRHSPAGGKFVYASAETDVLSRVLTAATGKTMADLTSEWLWKPMGAEHEAFWALTADGQERSYGGFNASLRDYARLGLMMANDGKVGAKQVLPLEYLLEATDFTRSPKSFQPRWATPSLGYGYQFWLLPMRERTFAMLGIHGQAVYVQPSSGIVMVHTAVWESASSKQNRQPDEERDALWRGVLQTLGGSTTE